MNIPKIFESEYRFCCILWDNEPVTSSELVKLCAEKLGWKKSTTYTVISGFPSVACSRPKTPLSPRW